MKKNVIVGQSGGENILDQIHSLIFANHFKEISDLLRKYLIYHCHFFLKINGRVHENIVKLRYFAEDLSCLLHSFCRDIDFIQHPCISDCCHRAVNLTFTCLYLHLSHLLLPKTGHKCSALCHPRSSLRKRSQVLRSGTEALSLSVHARYAHFLLHSQ